MGPPERKKKTDESQNRNEQNSRIALLETELRNHQELIRVLQESIKELRGSLIENGLDTTVASKGRNEDAIHPSEQSEIDDDVINNNNHDRQYLLRPGIIRNPDVKLTNLFKNGKTESKSLGRIKRTVSTTAAPPPRKKKVPKAGRPNKQRKRDRGNSSEALTCDFVNQCNGTMGRNRGDTLVAHFELDNDSDHLVSDEIIGEWNHASWMSHHEAGHRSFRIRSRRTKIEVVEPGIYYVYSQVTFADNGSYLAYSIMLDGVPTFTCRLFLTETVVDANSCMTGGLLQINAGQMLHIQLAEINKLISMDRESTFFGMVRMLNV